MNKGTFDAICRTNEHAGWSHQLSVIKNFHGSLQLEDADQLRLSNDNVHLVVTVEGVLQAKLTNLQQALDSAVVSLYVC